MFLLDKFDVLFEEAWNQAMDDAEEDYDAVCQEKEDEIGVPACIDKKGDCNIRPPIGNSGLQAKSKAMPVPNENPYMNIFLGSNFKIFLAYK